MQNYVKKIEIKITVKKAPTKERFNALTFRSPNP
ncbi:MAG: hypothetical protein JWR12_166 [Mucilaginibacter sp.]|nr:hypothetical protein [Mucilaginibacter sp.]